MISRKHFTTPIKVTQAEDNQVVNIFSTKKSSSVISDTERYINEKYVTTNLKQKLLCEIQRHFSSLQYSRASYVAESIAQIDFLKNEVFFLTKYLSEKNELIKSFFQNYLNPAFNLKKGLANKDFQETKSHNNFTSNSHNEKLNNNKSETNCTDDLHINNTESYERVKLYQPKSSNCPSKSNSGHENIHTNNSNNKEKEIGSKTELKESSQKKQKGKRVFILGDSILKYVNDYKITKKLDNCKIYLKSFSGAKIKCMENYVQHTMRTNPDHIVIHVGTKDLSSKNESAEISRAIVVFETKIKHLLGSSFIFNNTK